MIAKLIQVIETFERRGEGRPPNDPIRIVRQYWSVDGVLLAEWDPVLGMPSSPPGSRE